MGRSRGASRARAAARADLESDPIASTFRIVGVALVCAKVALIPLVFDRSLDWPFTVSKGLLSHALAYALMAVLAALFVWSGRKFLVWSPSHLPVLAFLAAGGIATLFATDSALALHGTHARMLGLGTIVDWVILYFAVALLVRTRGEVVAVVACALAASVLVLAYELVQLARMDPFQWSIDGAERPFSTVGQPTTLAQYLTTLAIGCVAVALLADPIGRPLRAALVFYSGVLLAGAAATGTRSALLGVAAGAAVLVVLVWFVHPSRPARLASIAVASGAAVALAALLVLSPLGARVASTFQTPLADAADDELLARLEPSAGGRLVIYEMGLRMVLERPLLGDGPDNFVVGVPKFRPPAAPPELRQGLATSAHSWAMHVATSSGVIGLVSFIAIVGVALFLAARSGFRPLALAGAATMAAYLGTGLTTVNDVATDWLLWASVGMIAGATAGMPAPANVTAHRPRTRRQAGPDRRRLRGLGAIACVAIGVVAVVATNSALDASRSIRSAQQARLAGRSADAITLALSATRSDPGRAEYWHGLGLAYVAASRFREASGAFERASAMAPYSVRYMGDLARALLLIDSATDRTARARALELGEQAVRTDSNNPQAHLTRAVVLQVTGNLQGALQSVERALALDPGSTNDALYLAATQIMRGSGRTADAVRVAVDGLAVLGQSRRSIALRIELARALVDAGRPAEALRELEAALAIQPGEPTAERLRAEIRAGLPQ